MGLCSGAAIRLSATTAYNSCMPRHPTVAPAFPSISPVAKPARGRPRKDEIDPGAIRALAALGLNATTIAARLGLSRRTLFERLRTDPLAREAYDEGLADLVTTGSAKLRELVEQGNVTALIFLLKTKGGWLTPREASPALPKGGPVIDASVCIAAARRSVRCVNGTRWQLSASIHLIKLFVGLNSFAELDGFQRSREKQVPHHLERHLFIAEQSVVARSGGTYRADLESSRPRFPFRRKLSTNVPASSPSEANDHRRVGCSRSGAHGRDDGRHSMRSIVS